MKMIVNLNEKSYPILIQRGGLTSINEYININRKIAIITDSGVPEKWISQIQEQFPNSFVCTFMQGEASKSLSTYELLQKELIEHNMTRKDAVAAVGGGVAGDLAGFVAATYMRGIDFYNIPTTVLSQVDSSVGGKVAVDMGSYKNIIGAFYQPKAVIIDPDVLSTLPVRHQNNGLVEALKMALILDADLISEFEKDELNMEKIISRSIDLKRIIVEQDEKEADLRSILNFGHTIGHAIESAYGLHAYLHGECVAMGMLYFIEDEALKERVLKIYKKLNLPALPDYESSVLMNYIRKDKKNSSEGIKIITCPSAGTYSIQTMTENEIQNIVERGPYEK